MSRRRGVLAALAAATALAGTSAVVGAEPAAAATCAGGQLMMSYFRSWRDLASDPSVNKTSMSDLPSAVNVAMVFPEGGEPAAFWTALHDTYVPHLHGQGTKVVRSIGVSQLINTAYADNESGYTALAQQLIADDVTAYNIDGLDIDVEQSLSGTNLQRATGVFQALATQLGPASGTGKLLIFDTNLDGSQALFGDVAADVNYVLEQSYGRAVSSLQGTWNSYAGKISSCQYLIGFSFYEENGTNWGDTTTPMTSSRAWQYANWQPSGATKGGIFSYAVDRDGVAIGDNTIEPTTYSWTIALKNQMNP